MAGLEDKKPKPTWLTFEFLASLAGILGAVLGAKHGVIPLNALSLLLGLFAFAYSLSRGLFKMNKGVGRVSWKTTEFGFVVGTVGLGWLCVPWLNLPPSQAAYLTLASLLGGVVSRGLAKVYNTSTATVFNIR